jgi:nicotinate-nucleotide pyrophosphorylase (carboxylating)
VSATPPARVWAWLVERALEEDLGTGDVTSRLVIPAGARSTAVIEAREPLVLCGIEVAAAVFERVDPSLDFVARRRDGEQVEAGEPLATVGGSVRALFAAERTALNFLGRLCGIASFTRRFVDAVAGTGARIVDTRKTLPGWRALDKYAVATGGGVNHRMGLFDGILLKDNHIAIAGGVAAAVKAALAEAPIHLRVQVEVESEEQAAAALDAGAHSLLLDNCPVPLLARLVERFGARALLEASGGVTLDNVRAVAATGVHRISIGALTHSAPAADVAMEMVAGSVRA